MGSDAAGLQKLTGYSREPRVTYTARLGYDAYACQTGDPLECPVATYDERQRPVSTCCSECGFPARLAPTTKIQGREATYQIRSSLYRRGNGRLYTATDQLEDSYVLKEYVLPQNVWHQKAQDRKAQFRQRSGLAVLGGQLPDFRFLVPVEVIVPLAAASQSTDACGDRCFMVYKGPLGAATPLTQHLATVGAMPAIAVRQVLDQALQSLEFLHRHTFQLPSGLSQAGLAHGNITLDSLLMVPQTPGFLIYLCDLALWEQAFRVVPLPSSDESPMVADLRQLGEVAWTLLALRPEAADSGPATDISNQNPEFNASTPTIHPAFKQFLLRLIGQGDHPFQSAAMARQVLRKLPPELGTQPQPSIPSLLAPPPPRAQSSSRLRWVILLGVLIGLGALGLGLGLWVWWSKRTGDTPSAPLVCCLDQLDELPAGTFLYSAEQAGLWDYVWTQPNLIAPGVTLQNRLESLQPQLKALEYCPARSGRVVQRFLESEKGLKYCPTRSGRVVQRFLEPKKVDFAVTSLPSQLEKGLISVPFAYDGLAVFVSFSYAKRAQGLPYHLGGKIRFDQLQQLYTGQIRNWRELGGPDIPVRLYVPNNDDAVRFFEERVLQDPERIRAFRALLKEQEEFLDTKLESLDTTEMLRAVIGDFERNTPPIGSIGFDVLSKVFGQCSVYPLALIEPGKPPIAPLIHTNRQPVTPETDLCKGKGDYVVNSVDLRSRRYPLAYPLSITHRLDNRRQPIGQKFSEILQTVEVQRLLQKTGLVPLQVLPQQDEPAQPN